MTHSSCTSNAKVPFCESNFPNAVYSQRKLSQMYKLADLTRSEHGVFVMVWSFFQSNNLNNLLRNQLPASTRWPEPHGYFLYPFQIESYSTFSRSHISTMLLHMVKILNLGYFRWSRLFSYQTTGFICYGISYLHLPADRNSTDISAIPSKSNLLELFSQAKFPQCYHIRSNS